jgi:thiamine pyrophosphate-dependent acetolactate synthase large subunit-like protein
MTGMAATGTTGERTRVDSAVAAALRDISDGTLFGLMGDDMAHVLAEVAAMPGVRYYGARHEWISVAMADGYARATGRLGVCVVSRGPGLTNSITGMVAARKAGSPVLIVLGDSDEGPMSRLNPKHVDQDALVEAAEVRVHRVIDADQTIPTLYAAASEAAAGTVVVVNIATGVLSREIAVEPGAGPPAPPSIEPVAPSSDDVAAAAAMLARSRRPLLLAGRGAIAAGAESDILALAEATGALLGTSLRAKDLFRDEPASIGVVGGFAHGLGRELLDEVDCVVAFGASLNVFTAGGGKIFAEADVCQVSLDPEPTGLAGEPDLIIRADARSTARALRDQLAASGSERSGGWPQETLDRLAAYERVSDFEDRSTPEYIDPRTLLTTFDANLPQDRTVVLDAGHFTGFAATYLTVPGPDRFSACLDFACISAGHGVGLGFAVAHPDAVNVLVIGDGGLLMTLGDLDTALRYRLPVVIVVMNDAAYGAELHFLALSGVPNAEDTTVFDERDFARIFEAMGGDAMVVRTVEDAVAAAERAGRLDGPLLLDCRINRDVRALWLEELFGGTGYGR